MPMAPIGVAELHPVGDKLLEMKDIKKSFGATRALTGVSISVDAGEVLALLGENGAGKSTLINILGGIVQPDGGSIVIDGKAVGAFPDVQAARRASHPVYPIEGALETCTGAGACLNILAHRCCFPPGASL